MHTLSNTVTRKFINTLSLNNLEIETDSGWQPISAIHKTIPYKVWTIKTASGLFLECADTHIIFDSDYNEIFVKDVQVGITSIITKNGVDIVTSVVEHDNEEHMFDISVESQEHRFYTNGILSHNTTIINALSFALFGVALTNIKKDNLINKINNKNMLVTLTFSINNINYRIERGRKPAIFNFINLSDTSKNQESDSQGESRDTQQDINTLIGFSHDMFKHILALNTYTEPFLSMKAGDQRSIIEQLLGITLLSEKAEALSKQLKDTKELLVQENANIEATKKANDKIQQSIDTLLIRQKAWNSQHDKDLDNIAAAIVELQNVDIEKELLLHNDLKIYDEKAALIKSLQNEKSTLQAAITQAAKTLAKYTKEMETLRERTCPACEQDLKEHKHEEMLNNITQHITESQKYFDKVSEDFNKISKELEDIGDINGRPVTFYKSLEEALTHQNTMQNLETQLVNKSVATDPYQDQIEELRTTAIQDIDWSVINDITLYKEHQEFLLKLLTNKDSFIRKTIINQNLSYLNSRLTHYLYKMGLPHTVIFQNDLSVEITQLGQDLDFDNLSRGERNRLILGLSWAFRDVWESLYQPINLLFIDELIDNGLDASGVENALSVLKQIARERKKNVFLISHKEELVGRVNNVLRVVKENGFTEYATDLEIIE